MRFMTTLFCAKCAEAHRPRIRQHFLHFTEGLNTLKEYDHTDTHEYGMTPHTVLVMSQSETEVEIQTLCMMDECGIRLFKTEDGEVIFYGTNNKPVVEKDGKLYQFNKDDEVVRYYGDIHFRAVVLSSHQPHTVTIANFNALLKMKL